MKTTNNYFKFRSRVAVASLIILFGIFILYWSAKNHVYNEQIHHLEDLQTYTLQLENELEEISELKDQFLLHESLSFEERIRLQKYLRSLEQIALNFQRETFAYMQNSSLNLLGSQNEDIDSAFDEARDTHLYINRFIRALEE